MLSLSLARVRSLHRQRKQWQWWWWRWRRQQQRRYQHREFNRKEKKRKQSSSSAAVAQQIHVISLLKRFFRSYHQAFKHFKRMNSRMICAFKSRCPVRSLSLSLPLHTIHSLCALCLVSFLFQIILVDFSRYFLLRISKTCLLLLRLSHFKKFVFNFYFDCMTSDNNAMQQQ